MDVRTLIVQPPTQSQNELWPCPHPETAKLTQRPLHLASRYQHSAACAGNPAAKVFTLSGRLPTKVQGNLAFARNSVWFGNCNHRYHLDAGQRRGALRRAPPKVRSTRSFARNGKACSPVWAGLFFMKVRSESRSATPSPCRSPRLHRNAERRKSPRCKRQAQC